MAKADRESQARRFRWGILGTGYAARQFALGINATSHSRVTVVGSRSTERAGAFAARLRIPRAVGSYEQAVATSDVDAFYVATPPSRHRDHAILCLDAGHPVLVEKPFAVDAAQAREIAAAARSRSLFCMEGMWTRFLPAVQRAKTMIDEGAVGEVRLLTASFCTPEAFHGDHHLFDPSLGGGALLDRGSYLVSLATHFIGASSAVSSEATIGVTGVDEQAAVVLRYSSGAIALLTASVRTSSTNDCVIMGSHGVLRLLPPIYRPFRLTLTPIRERLFPAASSESRLQRLKEHPLAHSARQRLSRVLSPMLGRSTRHHTARYAGNGYQHQAEEVARCVRRGDLESAVMPLAQSVSILETMDAARASWRGAAGDRR